MNHQNASDDGDSVSKGGPLAAPDVNSIAALEPEIRTPMSNIIGMADLLLDTPLDSRQRGYANIMRDSSEQLLGLLNDLIDSAKLNHGAFRLSSTNFDLTDVVESVASAHSVMAEVAGVTIMTFIAPEIPSRLRGDSERLRQGLAGMVVEVLGRSGHGEIIISAESAGEPDQPGRLGIRFSVTGIGTSLAPPEEAPTARAALTSRVRRSLIAQMGGVLEQTAGEDGRRVYSFVAQFEQPMPVLRDAAPVGMHDSDLSHLRVLVIADSKPTREILSRYVTAWNMGCDAVAGAADAVMSLRTAAASGWTYDVAIIDLTMPGINGFDLASIIKNDRAFASMALILLNAHDELEPAAAQRLGFSAFLTKPVRQSSLFDAIANVFYAGGVPAAAPQSAAPSAVGRPAVILLVEDNLANQKLAIAQLESMGCAVRALSNGRDAVMEVARNGDQYSMVLMDCQMPEMDGYEATQAIRAAEAVSGQRVPIVAMTANAMQGAREECLLAGMDDYLAKPVSRDRLREIVRKWAR